MQGVSPDIPDLSFAFVAFVDHALPLQAVNLAARLECYCNDETSCDKNCLNAAKSGLAQVAFEAPPPIGALSMVGYLCKTRMAGWIPSAAEYSELVCIISASCTVYEQFPPGDQAKSHRVERLAHPKDSCGQEY
jgi:hypothetical protein